MMAADPHSQVDQKRSDESKLLTLGDLLRFLYRRRIVIILVGIGVFGIGLLYCATATRRYAATTTIEIKPPQDSLGVSRIAQGQTAQEDQNPLAETVTLTTKQSELQSEQLALRVVDELGLEKNPDFRPQIESESNQLHFKAFH